MVEMMDKQPKNEQALKKQQITFHPIEKSLAVESLRKDFKTVLKQSVIQNLPLIINEFANELLKDNLNKSEKCHENQQTK
jgi:hypothetical protein